MMDNHQSDFQSFLKVHDAYQEDPNKWSEEFHTQGRDILDIIRNYERRLCSRMERGSHGKYSNTLSEKFWGLIKKQLPLVEHIGVRISKK